MSLAESKIEFSQFFTMGPGKHQLDMYGQVDEELKVGTLEVDCVQYEEYKKISNDSKHLDIAEGEGKEEESSTKPQNVSQQQL